MLQSHVIEIDGVFVGVAVVLDSGFRFIATDSRLGHVSKTIWPSLAEIRGMSRRHLVQTRIKDRPVSCGRQDSSFHLVQAASAATATRIEPEE